MSLSVYFLMWDCVSSSGVSSSRLLATNTTASSNADLLYFTFRWNKMRWWWSVCVCMHHHRHHTLLHSLLHGMSVSEHTHTYEQTLLNPPPSPPPTTIAATTSTTYYRHNTHVHGFPISHSSHWLQPDTVKKSQRVSERARGFVLFTASVLLLLLFHTIWHDSSSFGTSDQVSRRDFEYHSSPSFLAPSISIRKRHATLFLHFIPNCFVH